MATNRSSRILVVDPDEDSLDLYQHLLDPELAEVIAVATTREALEQLDDEDYDVVIAALEQEDMDGLSFLNTAQRIHEDLAVIMVTAFGSVQDAVAAMRLGAADFLTKPFSPEQLSLAVDKATRTHRLLVENQDLRSALDDRLKLGNFVASDPQMQRILKTVQAVARSRTTVLITGESGTGKTLLARAIHQNSPRHEGPFIEVNCGALPENLLESELFGHERGAFTGAVKERHGKFEAASGGTIFLDEIGTSTPAFQIKLLRVLQDRVIERVGSSTPIPVDVRIILATNADLEAEVAAGNFREDLFYRIQVITLEMPPLRARQGDVEQLAEHFLARHARDNQKLIHGFSAAAMELLQSSSWPGNIRQLENVVEHAVVLCEGEMIQPGDLPPAFGSAPDRPQGGGLLRDNSHLLPLKEALEGPEKLLIERALAHFDGNRNATAQSLQINRSTLFNKMRKYDLL